ncbi:uncharacterized protein AB675_8068 [Cyphellophora attinorum]|uniref:Beta-xylosidase C-terminal Concanavalin A-like domain-containing protein n=1 Tax=Cyphellophora attinorum TaxID=1664694 RepID=A0A0N0NN26_9EURO|nr:uncharacterized protein AB675_8068 [Phialophora attinorum]KPI41121.1 hypothetical protein AB675_8068 [Phialophora attinorum]
MGSEWQSVHYTQSIPDITKPFDIRCPPGTDVWEKPPSTHSFNAPIIYKTTTVGAFKKARVTVSANWRDRYDQGGLALVVNLDAGRQWIKSGIEYENDECNVATVATSKWSDWSLMPVKDQAKATLELERISDGSLWVWLVGNGGKRSGLREVTWWSTLPEDAELWVGVMAAKPAPNGEKEDLVVHFEDLSIDLA